MTKVFKSKKYLHVHICMSEGKRWTKADLHNSWSVIHNQSKPLEANKACIQYYISCLDWHGLITWWGRTIMNVSMIPRPYYRQKSNSLIIENPMHLKPLWFDAVTEISLLQVEGIFLLGTWKSKCLEMDFIFLSISIVQLSEVLTNMAFRVFFS